MADCIHCGTSFSPADPEDQFCCKGCEFVYELIREEGLGRYYDLREGTSIKPVRSVPFEAHDFGWLEKFVIAEQEKSPAAKTLEADFSLEGVSCIGCVWLVEKLFLRRPGALEAAAHPASGRVHLVWVAGEMDLLAFAQELVSFGYTLAPRRAGNAASESGAIGARLGLCGAFMMNAMGFALPSYLGMPDDFAFAGLFELVSLLTATLSMLVGASYFITRAWKALKMRILHIDSPIALGLLIGYVGSVIGWIYHIRGLLYFDFVSTFVFLMLVGRYLQIAAMDKNRQRLQRQRPIPEMMRSPDRLEPVALADLISGLRFELTPGQALPVAAVLDHATADFSLEWINGEAECCNFSAGRTVPAGAIYLGKVPTLLTAAETWAESMLAKLVTSERPAVRVLALENLLRYYLAAVLCAGIAGFAWWYHFHGLSAALQVMISVFVVSCPCSLGVSLPMADEIAGSMMERLGVFIRQPLLWVRLCRVKTLIFDKTGTLTLERPVLANPLAVTGLPREARLSLARLAHGSLHPVSRSLLEALGREGQLMLREETPVAVTDVPGAGRFFEYQGSEWSLGKPGWRRNSSVAGTTSQHDAELLKNGEMIGHFHFHESLRADAISALAFLKKLHYRLVILSGDRQAKVAEAADLLGVSEGDTFAALQPAEKERIVRELDRRDTLYLGDGANDSLAFNAAWTTGTPVVDRSLLEAKSDFYFMGQSLSFLPSLLQLAKRRQRVVRWAFAFALCYNTTAIFVSLQGQMSPLLAAILMPLSSVTSLGIVTLGLRDWRNRNRKLAILADKGLDQGQVESSPASHHDSRSDRLRPRSI
jgi:P-type Cu2+ transporter